MTTLLTSDELIVRLRKSGLIAESDLNLFLANQPEEVVSNSASLLEKLTEARYLTRYQATRLGIGKYKGFLLGSYVILDKLGEGGMGQVFLAEHTALRRLVAIKVLSVIANDDATAKERFIREARAAAGLDHPNIVQVYDLNREGAFWYLVQEHVDGVNLQALVSKGGKLTVEAAADYARQTAIGLQHAHENGLVHRDVKPGNIIVDRRGQVHLLDLGLVRRIEDLDSQLTNQLGSRGILGTADYLAPEQAVNSSNVDTRADVYSLGATLYFLLVGKPIFPEGRAAQKLLWHQTRQPTPIQELRPDVSEELAAIINKCLEKDPNDRFQTPAELARALAAISTELVPPDSKLIRPLPPPRAVQSSAPRRSGSTSVSATHRPLTSLSSSGVILNEPRVPQNDDTPAQFGPSTYTPMANPTMAPQSRTATSPALQQAPASAVLPKKKSNSPSVYLWLVIGVGIGSMFGLAAAALALSR